MADFNLLCPHCAQPLECSTDLIGLNVNCPVCDAVFEIAAPAGAAAAVADQRAKEPVKYWTVDVRMLILRSPPAYLRTLVEVPDNWPLPRDGVPSQPVLEAVTGAIKRRFPQRPATPIKVHTAPPEALRRCVDQPDDCDSGFKVWFLGQPVASL